MAFTLTSNHTYTTTFPLAWGSNPASGDLLVVGAINTGSSSATVSSVTDTLSTVYHSSLFGDATQGKSIMISWGVTTAGGANTTTITWSTGTSASGFYAEFSGTSVAGCSQDTFASSDVSATPVTVPSVTTTGSDDLLISFISQGQGTTTFNSPWTLINQTAFSGGVGYNADVTAGNYAANATISSTPSGMSVILAIKAAAAAAPIYVPNTQIPFRMPLGC